MADVVDFRYVDFATRAQPGFRNNVVRVGDLPGLVGRYGRADCYCTYFQFDNGLPDYVKQNHGSVAGYDGPCYARFLPLDVDASDLERAVGAARQITRFLLDGWGVPEEAVPVYYSGMKGFHVTLATGIFGEIQPGVELPRVFQGIRRSLVEKAKVTHPETIDFGISDRLRLLRLPNTRHSKSGLFKIPLRAEELLYRGVGEIREAAVRPRKPWLTDRSGLVPVYRAEAVPVAVGLFERCRDGEAESPHADLPDPGSFLDNGHLKDTLCQAELELYREGVPEGARSAMCLRLASRFRSAGYAADRASAMVELFASRCSPPLDGRSARQIAETAYRANGRGYQFGCGTSRGDPPQAALVFGRCRYRTGRLRCGTFRRFHSHLNGNGGDKHEA
jgi:hypothetical protein